MRLGRWRWAIVAVVVVALALAAAGCGDSTNVSNATAETATTSTGTESSEAPNTTSVGSSDASTAETTGEAISGMTGACKKLGEFGQKYSEALARAGSGGGDLSATASAFSAFADEVPDEIRVDFQTVANAVSVYAKALQKLDLKAGEVPSANQIAKLVAVAKSMNTSGVTKASANISVWVQANCGTTP